MNSTHTGSDPKYSRFDSTFIFMLVIIFLNNSSLQMAVSTVSLYIISIGGNNTLCGISAVVFAIAAVFFRFVGGRIFDRFGAVSIMVLGGLVFAAASLSFPLFAAFSIMVILRFFQGAGYALSGTSANASIAKTTRPERIGEGMSYAGMVTALAAVVGPALGIRIWRGTGSSWLFPVLAIQTILASVIAIVIRRRLTQQTPIPSQPLISSEKSFFDKSAIKPSSIVFLLAFSQAFMITYIILYGEIKQCLSIDYFFPVSAAVMILARVLFGRHYDRFGIRAVLIPAFISGILSFAILLIMPSNFGFMIGAVLYGFSYGMSTPALLAQSVKHASLQRKGAATATFYAAVDTGFGAGALLWGVLIDKIGYPPVIVLSAVLVLTALLLSLFFFQKASSALSQ